MIVRALLLAAAVLLLPAAAMPAMAAEITPADAVVELDRARDLVDESLAAYTAGRSAESLASPGFSFAQALSPSASGRPSPYQAKKRKKRRMRR